MSILFDEFDGYTKEAIVIDGEFQNSIIKMIDEVRKKHPDVTTRELEYLMYQSVIDAFITVRITSRSDH